LLKKAYEKINSFWKIYNKNKVAVGGLMIVYFFIILALSAPIISPYDPFKINLADRHKPPSREHLMGTDEFGRDVFSRIIWGSRISMIIGFLAAGISTILGIGLGSISGYYGGMIDDIIMRIVDIFMVIPTFFLILIIIALFGSSMWNVMVVIGITSWPGTARIMRAQFLAVREKEFIEAAKALGANDFKIILFHILPNAIYPVVVNASLQIAGAILTEASLSFLGLGDPSKISWGLMLNRALQYMRQSWWQTIFPGICIFLLVFSFNVIGDGLNDALNPRLRER